MTNEEAIDYLLYMKHDVQAGSPVDVAIDKGIEALKSCETAKKPKTNGDRIRQMTDEELERIIGVCECCLCAYRGECEKSSCFCESGKIAWLKQEVSEDAAD